MRMFKGQDEERCRLEEERHRQDQLEEKQVRERLEKWQAERRRQAEEQREERRRRREEEGRRQEEEWQERHRRREEEHRREEEEWQERLRRQDEEWQERHRRREKEWQERHHRQDEKWQGLCRQLKEQLEESHGQDEVRQEEHRRQVCNHRQEEELQFCSRSRGGTASKLTNQGYLRYGKGSEGSIRNQGDTESKESQTIRGETLKLVHGDKQGQVRDDVSDSVVKVDKEKVNGKVDSGRKLALPECSFTEEMQKLSVNASTDEAQESTLSDDTSTGGVRESTRKNGLNASGLNGNIAVGDTFRQEAFTRENSDGGLNVSVLNGNIVVGDTFRRETITSENSGGGLNASVLNGNIVVGDTFRRETITCENSGGGLNASGLNGNIVVGDTFRQETITSENSGGGLNASVLNGNTVVGDTFRRETITCENSGGDSSTGIAATVSHNESSDGREADNTVTGKVNGVPVIMELDTRAAQTWVRPDVVDPRKVDGKRPIGMLCACSRVGQYPITRVTIEMGSDVYQTVVGIPNSLPVSVVVGRGNPTVKQTAKEGKLQVKSAVKTLLVRIRGKAKERTALPLQHLEVLDDEAETNTNALEEFNFDDDMFLKVTKERKSRAQCRRDKCQHNELQHLEIQDDEAGAKSNTCRVNDAHANKKGSYSGSCWIGFCGNGLLCANIYEGNEGHDECDVNAMCSDTEGSFQCTCNMGFIGNGTYCEDREVCPEDWDKCNQLQSSSADFPGGSCDVGYRGTGDICLDVPECEEKEFDDGHPNSSCSNNVGSPDCNCLVGFSRSAVTCSNIFECDLEVHDCNLNAECINSKGSFKGCNMGYSGPGVYYYGMQVGLEDSEDCSSQVNCTNFKGSFTCDGNGGFRGNGPG